MHADVWKTAQIGANRSGSGPVHLQFGLSSNVKYIRKAVNLPCDIVSENIGIPRNVSFIVKKMKWVIFAVQSSGILERNEPL